MKNVVAVLLMLACGAAFAQGIGNHSATSTATSTATGGAGGAGGTAFGGTAVANPTSISGALSGGNTQIINEAAIPSATRVETMESGTVRVKTVPNVMLGSVYPSATCHGSTAAGVAVLGLGVGGGTSWQDEDCQYRETARIFQGMGMTSDAVAVICASAYAKAAPSCQPKP